MHTALAHKCVEGLYQYWFGFQHLRNRHRIQAISNRQLYRLKNSLQRCIDFARLISMLSITHLPMVINRNGIRLRNTYGSTKHNFKNLLQL